MEFGPVTMRKVADRAKVSRAAVSAALSSRVSTVGLSQQTRARIIKAAQDLGYQPNILTRSFSKQRSFLIGLISREMFVVFAMGTLKGLEETLDGSDYSLLAFHSGNGSEEQARHLEKCMSRRVEGLIIAGAPEVAGGPNHQTIQQLIQRGTPVVQIYRPIFAGLPFVMMDEELGAYNAVQHLLKLGHRKIAHVTHDNFLNEGKHAGARYRHTGFCRAMTEAGLEPIVSLMQRVDFITDATPIEQLRAEVAMSLVSQGITAVLAFNDHMAIELIKTLARMGIRVPHDMSVVGYDDLEASRMVTPALTTGRPNNREIGHRAARMLLDLLQDRRVENVMLEPELVVRESTGPAPTHAVTPRKGDFLPEAMA